MTYQAVYYRDASGREPVNEFIDALEPGCQASIDWMIGLLNALSDSQPELPFPHSSALKGPRFRALRELRVHCGRRHFRILFRRSGRFFVLLHMISKTSDIPDADKQIALDRWEDFRTRMEAVPRAKPRPMGRDAP